LGRALTSGGGHGSGKPGCVCVTPNASASNTSDSASKMATRRVVVKRLSHSVCASSVATTLTAPMASSHSRDGSE
jgi:hypothetical protein